MNGKRLEKVLQALSGRERALLFLREYKDGTNSDPGGVGVAFLSTREHREYARLISLIQFCSNELADIVLVVREQVAQEELRFLALEQLRRHADELALVRRYAQRCAKKATGEDAAHYRQITKLIRRARAFRLPFDVAAPIADELQDGEEGARQITVIIKQRITSCWVQLKSVDQVVGEYAEEFGGEDPLQPQIRGFLDDALARCQALAEALEEYAGAWELPSDLGEALVLTRKLAERALR